jgi:hypothetical protein
MLAAAEMNTDGAPGPVAVRTAMPLRQMCAALKALAKVGSDGQGEVAYIDPLSVGGTCSERPLPDGLPCTKPAAGQPADPRLGFFSAGHVAGLATLKATITGDGGWPLSRGVGAAVEPAEWRRLCDENGWPWHPGWGLADGGSRITAVHALREAGTLAPDANGPFVVLKDGHIAEMGTHAELMERSGIYQQMVLVQTAPPAPPPAIPAAPVSRPSGHATRGAS